jgi:hypothetical protein
LRLEEATCSVLVVTGIVVTPKTSNDALKKPCCLHPSLSYFVIGTAGIRTRTPSTIIVTILHRIDVSNNCHDDVQ